ncbi:MAG: zinc-dependent metalloprotease [Saprospiraceae bacterium]|nr:T9SS type A sorting domain-containing protein [Saprospiraceae bacterium]
MKKYSNLIIIMIYFGTFVNAQFTVTSNYQTPTLNTPQTNYYNLITNTPGLDYAYWVNLNDPMIQIQEGGLLTVSIDTADLEATFTPLNVEYVDSNNYEYLGAVLDTHGCTTSDYIIIEKYGGRLVAEIYMSGEYYRIFPITSGVSLLGKFTSLDTLDCAIEEEGYEENECECTMSNNSCIIDLLVTYPKSQYNNVAAMYDLANIGGGRTNYTLINSLVKHRIRLVGVTCVVYETDSWNENLSITTEVDEMRTLYDNTNSHLRKIIDSLAPDIVEHLSIGINFGNAYGITEAVPASSGNNFGVTKIASAISQRYTFVHELGHSMGGNHQLTMCPMQAFALPNVNLQTVVYAGSNPNRILNYSNPGRKHLNIETGDSEANNACVISNTSCDVAGISTPADCIPFLSRTFDNNCNPSNITVSVSLYPSALCNTNSYKYEYKYSFDGKAFTTGCSLSTNTTCAIGMTNKHRIFVKVILYSLSNVYITERTFMFNELCSQTPNFLRRNKTVDSTHNDKRDINVHTLITGDELLLEVYSHESISGDVYLWNVNGLLLRNSKITLSKGKNVSLIDLNDLPKGVYFLTLSDSSDQLYIHKFIK